VTDTSRKPGTLSAQEKRELLAKLLREKISEESSALSHGQRALWFLYRLAPESAAYNLLYTARLHFQVDVAALQRSVQALVRRYPILTATYAMNGKEPVQRLHKDREVQVETIDASSWSPDALLQRLNEEGNRPFDLGQGPLLRVKLYILPTRETILSLTIHHIVADLWSLNVLIDELHLLYNADRGDRGGQPAQLPSAGAPFTDYVRWQSAMLAGQEGERHWRYWQQKLTGELPVLKLPTDRPRPVVQTYRGASHQFQLSAEISQRLRKLAQAENATLYTLVLAVFELFLSRYAEQEELLIGTPMLGRNRPEDERAVGYFANPVVLRTNLTGNPTFEDLLRQVRQTVIEAIEHQDYPFPLLVERLQPRRDPGYSPLIQALFIWDKPEVQQPGQSQFEPFVIGQQGAPFDLTLTIFEVGDALSADFHYNVDLFDETAIARMGQHFQTLLGSVIAYLQERVLALPMLTDAERQRILVEWNATQSYFPEHICIHQLFEEQAQRTPDTVAVVFEQQRLTYRELNRRANRVAHALVAAGVGPDSFVGVAMERSVEMVVALLAVLKAGAAYVPLEPTYPRERLAYILQDAGLTILLTQSKLRNLFAQNDLRVFSLDADEDLLTSYSDENPASAVRPTSAMYMIYTSGSTGRPKGVVNIHHAVNNRLHWMQQAYQLTQDDRVLQKTPFSFDVAVWEFFWPLLNGARLVVARPGGQQDPAYLAALIQEQQITTLHFVPSMLQAFLDQPGVERCTSLKRVICSGEALSAELQKRFFEISNADLYNLYGPTEAAIDVTHWHCQRGNDDKSVPIGRPIANTQIYILNRAMQPVPIGVSGELYIGGVGLARGYFNRPELTAEKFVRDPFSDQPGARLFKSGDLARYRSDGAIEFLGRIDSQVKMRGVRIELGEIEAVLAQHPQIKDVVVTAREDKPGNKRLVAYLVLMQTDEQRVGIEELRAYLKEHLPQDMLPAAFVFLDAIPVNSNGKADRAALPAPGSTRPELEASYVAARTEQEEQLVQIWSEVLGLDRIGVQDNFFDLGGASIQSLQAVNRANESGIPLTPEMLFEYQTIAQLTSVLNTKEATQQAQENEPQQQALAPVAPQPLASPQQDRRLNVGNMLIESVGVYLPPRIVSTREVLEQCSRPIRFPLEQLTGIRNRRVAGETEFAFDLAKKAVEHCLSGSRYNPKDIDLLICSSISRYNGPNFHITFEPGTATQLRHHFGFANALAFDISNACTGMFTAMYIADAFLKAGLIRRALVVSGEYITHLAQTAQKEIEGYLDSRMACLTVGDAGAAVILEATRDKSSGFHEFEMFTLGHYYDLCIAKTTDKPHGGAIMYTDSVKVSAVNIQQAVAHAARVMERSGWPPEAFQHVIMHQTSKMTIYDAGREVNSYLGKEVCHEGNLISNIAERGNTATTTHFVALMDNILSNRIKANSNIVFGITGSGVNIGTALYTLDDLPDRLRRLSTGEWRPEKVAPQQERFVPTLPTSKRVRVESIGTLPSDAQVRRETLEMVRVAAERCLDESSYQRDDIDLLIYAGVFRDDFICEPSIAAMVAGTLDINADAPQKMQMFSFDLLNGPVGFLNACYTAIGMLQAQKAHTAMIVTSEVENNRNSFPSELLGIEETSSVMLLDASPDGETGFGNFVFKYFTEHMDAFTAYTQFSDGKTRLISEKSMHLEALYQRCISETVQELLHLEQLDLSQVKLVLPPQISSRFIDDLSRQMQLSRDRFVDVHTEHDLYTSSLPYALDAARSQGRVQAGDIGLIITVGPGIQVGCATYHF
jgi:amino acid adenylation domain-containing protein